MAISTAPTVPNNDVVLGTTGLWYVESASKGFSFFGTVSDAPAANKNNYQPFGGANATLWNIGPTANISITGIVGGFGNTGLILFTNTSTTYTITLPALSGSSSGANQFINSATVGPGVSVLLIYNSFNWSIVGVPGTGASGTVTSVGLSSSDFTVSGSPVTVSGTITANLATQAGVTAGSYTNSNVTVNSKGIITAISSGSAGGVTSVSATAPIQTSGSTGAITLSAALFGTSNSGVVPASGGGTTNYLRADGTWAAPPGTGISSITGTAPITASTTSGATTVGFTVPGSSGQHIYNNAGVLAGDPIVISNGTGQLTLGSGTSAMTLIGAAPAATGAGAALNITGSPGGSTSGNGGPVILQGGSSSSGNGGAITLSTGAGGGSGTAGVFSIDIASTRTFLINALGLTFTLGTGVTGTTTTITVPAPAASSAGATLKILAPNGGTTSGAGGNLAFQGGNGTAGGVLNFYGGTANVGAFGNGGGVNFLGGNGIGNGGGGQFLAAGGGAPSSGNGGDCQFQAGPSAAGLGGSVVFFTGTGNPSATNANDGVVAFVNAQNTTGVTIDQNGNIVLAGALANYTGGTVGAGGYGANADQGYYYWTPNASGQTLAVPAFTSSLIINPAAAYLAATVKLPSSPIDGQIFEVSLVNFTITTITWQDGAGVAGNVLGPPATIAANNGWSWKYFATLGKWIRRF